ncbi:TonB-dependent receptor [Olivibacter sp. XZL3]|uniref:SusC/RagA family TonB-linked outer membrane protein n=1 Tax=Olivibacter sp. XZL3 TaxID=1735116 RepID=UPI001064C062|nr:TonB-dependent receptor [Olivibacter sp. XZL3]
MMKLPKRINSFFITFFCLTAINLSNTVGQNRTVTGKVVDKEGLPLIAVSVLAKGTNTGTSTNNQGEFSLALPSIPATLVFNYVGYKPQEISIDAPKRLPNIVLEEDATDLDEVVVIGYGTVKKRDLTGAVTSVAREELTKLPTTNVMESVQGKAPGVDIVRQSGSATSGVSITVRGNRSITAGNGPLFIVDGMQYSSIQDINPNDIESMEVLKDASSTAIYGSRGANGVIIVTTKRGVSGAPRVSFNAYYGVQEVAGYPRVMNGQEYVALRREAYRTTGVWNSPADDAKIFSNEQLGFIENNVSTDYADMLLGTGHQQDYQLNISGGTEKLTSYFSLDFFNEKGLFEMDDARRYTARLNLDYQVTNTLKVGTQTQLTYYDQNKRADPLNQANKISPLNTPFDAEGNYIIYPGQGGAINPLADEQPGNYKNNVKTLRVFPTVFAELKPVEGLSIRGNFAVNLSNLRDGLYEGSYSIRRNGANSRATYVTNNGLGYNWQAIVNYQKSFGEHDFSITGISEYLYNDTENATAQGENQLLDNNFFYNLGSNTQNLAITSAYTETKLLSYAARVNYGYKGKYLLTLTARTDGASQLAVGNKWDFFPSVAGAWRIVDEGFMKEQSLFSDLKLRASYGVSGNSSVVAYSSQSTLTRIPFAYGDASAPGYGFPNNSRNPQLGWEKSANTNIGLDFGLFKGRLNGTLELYHTSTSDLLLDRILPPTSGYSFVTQNIGKTENKGIEFMLNAAPISNDQFKWNSTVSFTKNIEKVKELIDNQDVISLDSRYVVVGYPVNSYFDYEKLGIWQLGEEGLAAAYGQSPGDIRVRDQNGDDVITADGDRVVVGSQVPKWSLGWNNDFSYKSFDLNINIFARIGQMINANYLTRYDPQAVENSTADISYWTPENPSNEWPRPNANLSRTSMLYTSTLGYTDGSFVKLRNVTLGYTLPASLTDKWGLAKLKVYVSGRNLAMWTKTINGYDPERGGGESAPLTRLIVAGINVNF